MKLIPTLLAIGLCIQANIVFGQNPTDSTSKYLSAKVEGLDTIGLYYMPPLVVRGDISTEKKAQYLGNKKLIYDLKKVMPFAKEMAKRIQVYDHVLDSLEKKKAEKKYIRTEARKLRKDFENDMMKLNLRQGKLLIKLIYRETGHTGYELLGNYKGNGTAIFWNGFASIFGASLKKEYHADDEAEIEYLVEHLGLD